MAEVIDLQRANCSLIFTGTSQTANHQLDCAPLINGLQQLAENIAVYIDKIKFLSWMNDQAEKQEVIVDGRKKKS